MHLCSGSFPANRVLLNLLCKNPCSCAFSTGSSRRRRRQGIELSNISSSQMAAKILANLIIMGSGILGRALVQAYRRALENANKTGVAHEAINNIRRASKTMTEQEARQILGISEESTWEEVLKKYDTLFENNAKNGSFYLQSKVHRAKECLESVYQKTDQWNS